MGILVTPANRRSVEELFNKRFMGMLQQEKYENMTLDEKKDAARFFARLERNREQKHHAAWKAGKSHYNYKGSMYPVVTPETDNKSEYASQVLGYTPDKFSEEE